MTIVETLVERGERYGKFKDQAKISQRLKELVNNSLFNAGKDIDPDMQEALEMICHKMARIINGDHNYADSWHDIAGYASLIADRLNGAAR